MLARMACGNDRRQVAVSAPADRGNDLQAVAVLQHTGVKLAAWHDFAVAFHGDAFAGQPQLIDQVGAARCAVEGARFTIDDD